MDITISEMLARNGRIYPHEVALVQVTPSQNIRREITWEEFDTKANKVVNFLISRGIQKGDKVLLIMRNCIEWLVVYFGILRTGACVVPLNFRFVSQDIKFCADVVEPKAFILAEEFMARVEAIRSELNIKVYAVVGQNAHLNMENLEAQLDGYSASAPDIELTDEDICAIYFTSGTTGTPKPIALTHKNLKWAAISSAFRRQDNQNDASLVVGPLYHTGAKMHWMGNLIAGGRGVLLVDERITPRLILETIHNERITEFMTYMPWVRDLLVALDKGELSKEDYNLSCLRFLHMGAQHIPASVVKHWKRFFPNVPYIETYGLTESTGPGCICLIGIDKEERLLGRAGFNWEVRIVDDQGNDVPVGKVGEIIVRGEGVMKEYYKNPQETAKVLKDGWLYTGDLGRMDEEGLVHIVDRKKEVIISGGENIYPSDVEPVLLTHPKVLDAALISIPDDRLGELAVAVIEPKAGVILTEQEMVEFCEEKFPRYRRPRKIVLDKVERDALGKMQRRNLREKYVKSLSK